MEFLQDDLRVFVVPVEILDVPDLTTYEKLVYIILRSYANPREATAFPSYATIAKQGSMSRRQAIRCVESLVEKGLIRKEIRMTVTKDRKIRNTSNLYRLERPQTENPSPVEKPAKRKRTSDSQSPPLVTDSHPPSDSQSPEHNHLTKPIRNMDGWTEAAATSSDPILEVIYTESKKIHIGGVNLSDKHMGDIYAMLTTQYPTRLDANVIRKAFALFVSEYVKEVNRDSEYRLTNPVGWFKTQYDKALKHHKAMKYKRNKEIKP